MIFASSPPSSMATSVTGMKVSTAVFEAMTSCTNSMPSHCASSRPPDPVMAMVMRSAPKSAAASESTSTMVARTSAWWRRYTENFTSWASSRMASLTVVEPTSMPICRLLFSSIAPLPYSLIDSPGLMKNSLMAMRAISSELSCMPVSIQRVMTPRYADAKNAT